MLFDAVFGGMLATKLHISKWEKVATIAMNKTLSQM